MSLRKKAVSGLFWTFSQQFGVQGINFVVSVLLARVLMPEAFGIIGMIAIFMAVGRTLMDSGLTSSLIRTPNADQLDYSTVFLINLGGSVIIYAILFFTSPLIAAFFDQEVLTDVIRVYCLTFIIRAFSGVQSARLTKEMNFKMQMTIQIPSLIGGGILGIYLAHQGYEVWSLVWMNVFQATLSSLQLWIRSGWTPSFAFSAERFQRHFGFGYKLTLSSIIDTIYQNLYNIVIAKFFSAAQLGYYTRAQSLKQLPVSNISTALNKVTYPMFAKIQDDNAKLKIAYKKAMQQVLFWVAPTLVILAAVAEPLFRFMLTEKWLPAVPYFQLLCVVGIMYPLNSYNLNILKVKGRSDLFLRLEIIKKAYITLGIFCAIPFGIYGLLYFQVISTFISFFINTYYSGRMINYPVTEQIRDIAPIITLAGVIFGIASATDYWLAPHTIDIIRVGTTSIIAFLLYLAFAVGFRLNSVKDFKNIVLQK
jgi:Membrane protein involved in the export of O-antigen and teichoic acid